MLWRLIGFDGGADAPAIRFEAVDGFCLVAAEDFARDTNHAEAELLV